MINDLAVFEVGFLPRLKNGGHPVESESGELVGEKHVFVHEHCWALSFLTDDEVLRNYSSWFYCETTLPC